MQTLLLQNAENLFEGGIRTNSLDSLSELSTYATIKESALLHQYDNLLAYYYLRILCMPPLSAKAPARPNTDVKYERSQTTILTIRQILR